MEKQKLVSTWEGITKDNEGEAHIHTLHKYEYPDDFDESKLLNQAAPTKITSSRTRGVNHKDLLLADVPDIHYGLRKMPNGELIPTHQPEVMDVWLQIMKDAQPNTIILGGDMLDIPELSRFEMDSNHFVDTLQISIDGLYKYLSRVRADNPNAKIVALGGNHDEVRLKKFMLKNAMPLFGIKPANMPESFSATSFPFLMRLDDLEIDWVGGYPASNYKINDRLYTRHGEISKNGASTASFYLGKLATSLLFHHTHRREYARRTFPNGQAIEAFSFGCQANVKGAVPSFYNSVDDNTHIIERFENWDNGGGFVQYNEGDSPFKVEQVAIEAQDNYEALWNNKLYKARQDVIDALASGK